MSLVPCSIAGSNFLCKSQKDFAVFANENHTNFNVVYSLLALMIVCGFQICFLVCYFFGFDAWVATNFYQKATAPTG